MRLVVLRQIPQRCISGIIVECEFVSVIQFNARFDGRVIVPEQAVNLPQDRSFTVRVEPFGEDDGQSKGSPQSALEWLADNAVDDELPVDLSSQHDHYLYGTHKRG
jgi:hypothetical protein